MRKKVGAACIVMLAVFCGFELYHQTGMVHATRKNGFGCLCHGFDPVDSVRVWISGPDSLMPGEVGVYSVHVAKRSSIAAGFNVASYRSDLGIIDSAGTQLYTESPGIDSLELTHTYPPRPANGSDTISWSFSLKAPPVGGFIDTLYSAGNSVDLDVSPDGDAWNFGQNFPVRIVGTNDVGGELIARGYRLQQNYPNPFNPSTTIRYEIAEEGAVQLQVFDVSGRLVATLLDAHQNSGPHEITYSPAGAEQLSSGVYLYRLTVRPASARRPEFVAARKMLFLK